MRDPAAPLFPVGTGPAHRTAGQESLPARSLDRPRPSFTGQSQGWVVVCRCALDRGTLGVCRCVLDRARERIHSLLEVLREVCTQRTVSDQTSRDMKSWLQSMAGHGMT